jgi:methionyl-tRNA synthetase
MSKSYLLAGGAPTPNGRLHLGHIGAQFLKLDMLKRHLCRHGARATLMFSMDAFDTPVYLTARREGRTEEDVCRTYYAGIARDLECAGIGYDAFLDTASEHGRKLIRDTATELDTLLAGRKVSLPEKIPYGRRTGTQLTGRLLAGECPACGRTIRGYCCDPCGLQFSPDQLVNPRSAGEEEALSWREVTNDFVDVDSRDVRDYIASRALPAVTRRRAGEVANVLLSSDRFLVRWTASEPWGIGTGVSGQVFFNRVLITLVEQVLFGEMTRTALGLRRHPFAVDSETTTVLAYGVDNLGGRLVEGPALALATGRYRPFDHHLVSEFYLRDGAKMSTSGPNALWVSDAARLPGFSADALRAYMAAIATPEAEVEVSRTDLTGFMGPLTDRLGRIAALASSAPRSAIRADTLAAADRCLDRQAKALELPRLDLPEIWRTIEQWIRRVLSSGIEDLYADLMCFAVVAFPITPDIAGGVWRRLGRTGAPESSALRKGA